MIDGYKPEFLADPVASYLFEKAKAKFIPTIYHGIYRDDGLVVFKGNKKASEIRDWLEEFHKPVNKAVGNQQLQLTAEIWMTEENYPTPAKEERFQIVKNNKVPFIDMKMRCSPEGDLQCIVFRKKGQ